MNPTVLIIMDGYGIRNELEGNAIKAAWKPSLDKLFKDYPLSQLEASGEAVGLPKGIMGNSEVGHTNIGSGRTVFQDLMRINQAIEDGSFFKNEVLLSAINHVKENKSSLHFMGLLSDGQVHSHIEHLFALMKMAATNHVERVYLHAFLDGRDTRPKCAEKYIKQIYKKRDELSLWMPIATIMGRYYAMDRDNRWQRGELAYDAMVNRKGIQAEHSINGLLDAYKRGESDEFVKPTITDEGQIQDNDAVIFFNFRNDRTKQLTKAFIELGFDKFERKKIENLKFCTMTNYDKSFDCPVAFNVKRIENTLAEYLSKKKKTQFHTAETEKYAHVTFFFNGGVNEPVQGEDRKMIPSPQVATYDIQPEMSAIPVKDNLLKVIEENKHDFIVVNFANCDMVGHTGKFDAVKKAVETVDECVGEVVQKVLEKDGNVLIIADHGNAEEMIGEHQTSHTTNPVPCCLISKDPEMQKDKLSLKKGKLGDVAPTILKMMHIPIPEEMDGKPLF